MLVLYVALIGFSTLLIPNVFADVYVHESEYPFSIQHPPGWIVSPEDEWRGVDIRAEETGLNGFYVNLWCSESKGDDWCGTPGADYQEMKKLKDDEQYFCNSLSMAVDHMTCHNLNILDEIIHQVDSYRAFTIIFSASVMTDGKIPNFPLIQAGTYETVGTTTYVLVDNDIWVLASSYSPPQNFDAALDQKIISSFKIKNIYAQEDMFAPPPPTSWIDELIRAIMSLFGGGNDEPPMSNSVIREPMEEYIPEQEYQWDNPIIIDDLEF